MCFFEALQDLGMGMIELVLETVGNNAECGMQRFQKRLRTQVRLP